MSWSCQRCRQPLLLHPSVSSDLDLNQSAYDLVQDSFIAPRPTRSSVGSTSKVPASQSKQDTTETASPSASNPSPVSTGDANSLSARLAASSALFALLSHPPPAKSNKSPRGSKKTLNIRGHASAAATIVDHPLCKACTDTLLDIMDTQMSQVRAQRDSYLAFEAELRRYKVLPRQPAGELSRRASSSSSSSTSSAAAIGAESGAEDTAALQECESLQNGIGQLLSDESIALTELREAESARLDIGAQLAVIAEEEAALEQEEERFWSQYSTRALTLSKLGEEKASLAMAVLHDRELLTRLQATNVYTDAFCIGHSGGIATINGLRLGRLPGQIVEWNEINAAWGQTALLLDVVARKLGLAFRGYKLIPKGSFSVVYRYEDARSQHGSSASTCSHFTNHSRDTTAEGQGEVEEGGRKEIYELYGSSDWQIGRLLQSRRFDHAQTGFLACLKQVVEYVEAVDVDFRVPHVINKDKIGEASIRLQFGSDETWTRTLRHVLVNANRVLMWIVEREKTRGKGEGGRVVINGRDVGSVAA